MKKNIKCMPILNSEKYSCKICNRKHYTKKQKKECEKQGVPEVYPVHLIYKVSEGDDLIIILDQSVTRKGTHEALGFGYRLTNSIIKDITCGYYEENHVIDIYKLNKLNKVDTKNKLFKRAVNIVKELNLYKYNKNKIQYWNGEKVEEYKDKK